MTTSDPSPVALITGAARRIGAAIAERLHADGYRVMLHYRQSHAEAAALAQRLNDLRAGSAALVQADLDRVASIPALIAHTVDGFGRLDALVNNASQFVPMAFSEVTAQAWDDAFAANARAPFFLAQAAAPHLRDSGGGIVNLTDYYATRPRADLAVHAASKAALASITQALALALAPHVRVNAVAPGAILWPEHDADPAMRDALLARTPLARIGTAEEVAAAVAWLLRDATYCTGQVIAVDGGRGLT